MGTIIVSNLGKAYKQYPTKLARLAEWLIPGNQVRHCLKWVMQDINFTVNSGEAVGIIGINGAGKSTLLKMITGTTQPTTGSIEMTGRVAALLELGMGFHPDFTGRENVYMSAQLLGIKSNEIDALLPSIIAFAEINDYIDQPVRVYSSGMQMRLAFSVATAVRPDILIIDEALSVGDAYFQHKSFERIREYRTQGTTLLIVSHDKQAIQSICDKAILLSDGKIAMQGKPEAVMDYYNALLADNTGLTVEQNTSENITKTSSGSKCVEIMHCAIYNEENNQIEIIATGQHVKLKAILHVHQEVENLVFGFLIKNRLGQDIFGTNTYQHKKVLSNIKKGKTIECIIDFNVNLGEGSYSVSVAAHRDKIHIGSNYDWQDLAIIFNVINVDKEVFVGSAWLPTEINLNLN